MQRNGSQLDTLMLRILSFVLVLLPGFAMAEGVTSYTLTDGTTLAPLDRFKERDVCPEMIVMPPGAFMMGAIKGESRNPYDIYGPGASGRKRGPDEINIIPNEHPRHPVEMDIPYAIARNGVTHAEWMLCVDAGGCAHDPDHSVLTINGPVPMGPEHPVFNVSYLDILDYVAWLNMQVGADVYRLPTEAEWEYAARAGTETRFAQGDNVTPDQANFSRRSTERMLGISRPDWPERWEPVPVEDLDAANAWGVRHMSGNVFEVTLSCFAEHHLGLPTSSAYLAHAQSNGPCRRVGKGGAYNAAMDVLRPSRRTRPTEDRRRDFVGFRIIREFGTGERDYVAH